MPGNSKVTIAISTYNSADYLRASLTQLLGQSMISECEILVVDSGSEQEERSICAEFAQRLPALTYHRTARETLYAAWNRALAETHSEFFVNANTDDSLHPQALRILSDAMRKNPEAALAYGDWIWSPVPNAQFPWNPSYRRIFHERYHPQLVLFYAYAGCHQFWRTSKLREVGGFPSSRHAAGDYEALCALIRKRFHAVYVPMAISAFYQNPKGISRRNTISHEEFTEIRNRLRKEVDITDIFALDSRNRKAQSQAWVALAEYAITMKVPWHDEVIPDIGFAMICVDRALAIFPQNKDAQDLCRVLNKTPSSVLYGALSEKSSGGFLKSLRSRISKIPFLNFSKIPHSRVPSPVFDPQLK